MKNKMVMAGLVFAALAAMAAVVPVTELKVVKSGDVTKSVVVSYDGTNLLIPSGMKVDTSVLLVDATTNRVGINNAAPSYTLDVTGNERLTGNLIVDTTTLTVDATSNRVGIGTATPSYPLDVYDTTVGYGPSMTLRNPGDPGTGATRFSISNTVGRLDFNVYGSTAPGSLASACGLVTYGAPSALLFGGGPSVPIKVFSNNAYTAPQMILDTAGALILTGNLSVGGTYVTLPGGCRDWGKRTAAPTSPTPVEGDRYWLIGTGIKYWNGSDWI